MLGSEQVRPVIGAVESGSVAARAGLGAGQEIVAIDGEPTSGWAAVNLQLVRRLGESGSLQLMVREQGSTVDSPRELVLDKWLKGADEPDPIRSLGIRPWRPAMPPILAELDPKGPAQAAGLKTGDRLLALDGQPVSDWQQVVDSVRVRPDSKIVLRIERDGAPIDVPVALAARGESKAPTGYLGAGVKAVDWPPEMIREVSFGPVAAIGEGARRTWTMSVLTLDSLKKNVVRRALGKKT
nr:hypothetical protein GCM10020185_16590 [Pseudomonas brassicacearum subsp. brassicacearum]